MKTISRAQVLLLHTRLVHQTGGSDGIRDNDLLDAAMNAPFQTFDNIELYPTVVEKAVRFGFGLIRNHPFVDGNKRIGTHVMLVLLDLNGIVVEYEDEDIIEMILHVADGSLNYQELLRWVRKHIS